MANAIIAARQRVHHIYTIRKEHPSYVQEYKLLLSRIGECLRDPTPNATALALASTDTLRVIRAADDAAETSIAGTIPMLRRNDGNQYESSTHLPFGLISKYRVRKAERLYDAIQEAIRQA